MTVMDALRVKSVATILHPYIDSVSHEVTSRPVDLPLISR